MTYETNGLNITVSWTEVPDATGYTLYYAAYPYTNGDTIGSLDLGTETSYSIDLWEGAAYYIAVRARNGSAEIDYSNIEQFTITTQVPPEAPSLDYNLDGTTISMTWDLVPTATGYRLHYTIGEYSSPDDFSTLDVGADTSFSYDALQEGESYTIALRSYNAYGESGLSNIERMTISSQINDNDNDGDGYTESQGDCDDTDPKVYPFQVFIGGQSSRVTGFLGEAVEEPIQVFGSADAAYQYALQSGPAGMSTGIDGMLRYVIPDNVVQGSIIPFQVLVTPLAGGCQSIFDGNLEVLSPQNVNTESVGTSGGMVTDAQGQVSVEVPPGAVSAGTDISITSAVNADGNQVVSLQSSGPTDWLDVSLPGLTSSAESTVARRLTLSDLQCQVNPRYAWFLGSDERVSDNFKVQFDGWWRTWRFSCEEAYKVVPKPEDVHYLAGREAILFIHGFYPGDVLGGGDGTWGVFPQRLVNKLHEVTGGSRQFSAFEFRWRTNARFQDVATDLKRVVYELRNRTGKNVHIVAHSFGGLLARSYLQGLAGEGEPIQEHAYSTPVASLTTLGTPHSGIADSTKSLHQVWLPGGQDSGVLASFIETGGQISMHQAGESTARLLDNLLIRNVDGTPFVANVPGEVVAALNKTSDRNDLEYRFKKGGLPVQVLIGLRYITKGQGIWTYHESAPGDGLISYDGQRFNYHAENGSLLDNRSLLGANITESTLGGLTPGQTLSAADLEKTYKHNGWASPIAKHNEVNVSNNEAHDGFERTWQWIKAHPATVADPPTSTGTVTSPTGRVWMDRNLGASQVATAYNDSAAYGDLYQWGRGTDGHEKRTSPTTTTLSSSDAPGHDSFILAPSSPYDWRSPQNNTLWQGASGVNNPCPSGFRLPTIAEWEAERATWSSNNQAGAFASPLNLVSAGDRFNYDGAIYDAGSYGYYWSSSVDYSNSSYLYFGSGYAGTYSNYGRADGFSARCLED